MQEGRIVKVSGPLIVAENMADVKMFDVVKVGDNELIGEVIELRGDRASIQVYEETSGLGVGDKVVSTGYPLSVELAPGLIEGIFDGIQRPLEKIVEHYGDRITRGLKINNHDRVKKWKFIPKKKVGDEVVAGDVLGVVNETSIVEQRILVPYGVSGRITVIKSGEFTITETIAKVGDAEICMLTRWPVRKARPYKEKQTGSKSYRHPFPDSERRRRGGSRTVRKRKDGRSAPTREVGGRRDNSIRRLRRTRKRNDGRFKRVSRTKRPENGRASYEEDGFNRQHFGYARCGERGEYLHGYNDSRVFQRYGI